MNEHKTNDRDGNSKTKMFYPITIYCLLLLFSKLFLWSIFCEYVACGFWCCCCCFIYSFNFCIFLHIFVHIIITCAIGNLCKIIDFKLVGASKWRESKNIQMKFDFHKFWRDNSANLIEHANFSKKSSHLFFVCSIFNLNLHNDFQVKIEK